MLDKVRNPLLEEAQSSPSLLSDLAGLEQYIAESYDSRSFIELLQNADDASSSRFRIAKSGRFLLVANDGRNFTQKDFESLCRSAASSKSRGNTIGYRGIGFKSVVGFAKTIHLISGNLEVTFSREKTALLIPQAKRVPLIRIPHPLEDDAKKGFSEALGNLIQDGFNTIFVFDHLLADAIDNEFSSFDPSSLLFLRSVRHVELQTKTEAMITASRKNIDERSKTIRLKTDDGVSQWLVIEHSSVAIAFAQEASQIVRLDERSSVVHAFLPTTEPTGLYIKIHGDISTDPSRTRVVLDERTANIIKKIAALVVELLMACFFEKASKDSLGMVSALIPETDPRLTKFQKKSFKSELLSEIQRKAKEKFANLRCRPQWLNVLDFEKLAASAKLQVIPRSFENVEGVNAFLRFLGAREADFEELASGLFSTEVSIAGSAEIIAYFLTRFVAKQIDISRFSRDWLLWPTSGRVTSFEEIAGSSLIVETEFLDLISEKTMGRSAIQRMITAISDETTANKILGEASNGPSEVMALPPSQETFKPAEKTVSATSGIKPLALKRWRGAEQHVFQILSAQNWQVEDVSRQNVGYDIEGVTENGEEVFIEVKLIESPSQPFTLTSNEEAVARQKGLKYQIALVRQTGNSLEVAFIRDPVKQLKMTRQCRQWVWECSDYIFEPKIFPFE